MQCVSVRLDIKVFTMLLVYYKTILAFSTATLLEERSNKILWEISKTDYYIGSSGIFGEVYKGFKFKSLKKETTLTTILRTTLITNIIWHLSLSHVHIQEKKRRRFTLIYYCVKHHCCDKAFWSILFVHNLVTL